jgi:LCP family protein required for cell wall assembly
MPPRVLVRVVVWPAFMAIIVAGCGVSPTPTLTTAPTASSSSLPPSAIATALPTVSVAPSALPSASSTDLSTHPFTVLVLGGDNGFRTDAMIVVGVDPVARTLAFASIPRDTADVPLPGGGILQNQKINSFYDLAASHPSQYPQGPGRATADMVGTLLGIHIDYFGATTFNGFTNLVQAMGGATVTLPKAVVDPFYQVTTSHVGVTFPKGTQHLSPSRALIFVRTRQGDNDFERERRQQLFLLAVGRQLVSRPALLAGLLLAAARGNLKTDFPLDQLPVLISAVGSVDPGRVRQAVLGPSNYESATSCTCGYALRPNLPAMRKLARTFFPWAVASQ